MCLAPNALFGVVWLLLDVGLWQLVDHGKDNRVYEVEGWMSRLLFRLSDVMALVPRGPYHLCTIEGLLLFADLMIVNVVYGSPLTSNDSQLHSKVGHAVGQVLVAQRVFNDANLVPPGSATAHTATALRASYSLAGTRMSTLDRSQAVSTYILQALLASLSAACSSWRWDEPRRADGTSRFGAIMRLTYWRMVYELFFREPDLMLADLTSSGVLGNLLVELSLLAVTVPIPAPGTDTPTTGCLRPTFEHDSRAVAVTLARAVGWQLARLAGRAGHSSEQRRVVVASGLLRALLQHGKQMGAPMAAAIPGQSLAAGT
jgi:hypothetical protein